MMRINYNKKKLTTDLATNHMISEHTCDVTNLFQKQ